MGTVLTTAAPGHPPPAAGVSGLQRSDAENEAGKSYAMLVADTVVVKAGGPPDVATALAPKDWKEVAYFLKVRGVAGSGGRAVEMLQKATAAQCGPQTSAARHHGYLSATRAAASTTSQRGRRSPAPCMLLQRHLLMQDAGEDEAGAGEPEEAAAVYEVGMRKSARTEQIDFKQREEERWVGSASSARRARDWAVQLRLPLLIGLR